MRRGIETNCKCDSGYVFLLYQASHHDYNDIITISKIDCVK